ncbi:hypothetical protein C7974DRAFT_281163, partial [Boeremia exigua]|uniref:uncharacterized protein n=1 Tax=Boeremia exigua TaxID=749465 RepID=UPI001E8CBA4C
SPNYAFRHSLYMQQLDHNHVYPPTFPIKEPLLWYPVTTQFYFKPRRIPGHRTAASAASPADERSNETSYPCPVAKQFRCIGYFSAPGHANRHAKRHTGTKDAYCPECNKVFTRKDNIEQHRRTHWRGRKPRSGTNTVRMPKPAAKR